jgi:PKD repeat protein
MKRALVLAALIGFSCVAPQLALADIAPVVTAPAMASGAENTLITFTVSAADPDGDPITSLTAAPLPLGATFTKNASNTSGTFSWTPTFTQEGAFSVAFTATNALSGSATTAITVTHGDFPPVVTAPASASGNEGGLITFVVTAVDRSGATITSLAAAPLPSGATFTSNASHTSGTFSWTPTFTQSGTYNVTFTATGAFGPGSATTSITVNNVDRAPVVTAPPTMTACEGRLVTFPVTASDPDGDAIASLTAAGLPTGATFTVNATNTSGTFSWTPTFTAFGSYNVTFTALNALSGSATTVITVLGGCDRAPVVTAPLTASGTEGSLIAFTVTAFDPDGSSIVSLTATGLPAGATFTANASNTSGTFSWTPTFTQDGTYSVTFTASNTLSGSATTNITVGHVDPPVISAPATALGDEGTLITFTVTAFDPDGDALTLTALGLPLGAMFTVNASGTSGTFSWTPLFTQSGTYSVTFRANDGKGGIANAMTSITVNNVDRAPTADAGPDRTGLVNTPISFDGSGSTDPDGDALTYEWDFGDGTTGSGATASHTYTALGTYTATLTVTTAIGLADTDTAIVTIVGESSATAFTTGGNNTTSLGSGKPYTCVQIQPDGGYTNFDVNLATIRMQYTGGTVTEIFADATKTTISGDKNGDGITEITACFRKADLRLLFSGLPAGQNTVTVDLRGDLITGGGFHATLTMVVKSTGGALAASISPNPLNPRAKLTFATTKPGAIRVQMFDPQGRLVKTIADGMSVEAGSHDFEIDGTSAKGTRLASGLYFVKVWSQYDGQEVKSIAILK